MNELSSVFAELAEHILEVGGPYKATKYLSEKETIKATRKRYEKKILRYPRHNMDIVFTIGRPNYEERKFIKRAKKAGKAFPIKEVQVKFV